MSGYKKERAAGLHRSILPLLPVGVGKDAGTEPESLADARPWAAASEASSGVALPATLSSIHTFGACPSEVSLERWPKRSGVLVLRVWVTEGQLDWTPVFSLNTSSLPHSALSCCCHSALPVGCPRPRCFLRAQSGLCPGSLITSFSQLSRLHGGLSQGTGPGSNLQPNGVL